MMPSVCNANPSEVNPSEVNPRKPRDCSAVVYPERGVRVVWAPRLPLAVEEDG